MNFDILLSSPSSACLLPSLQHPTQLNTMSGRGKGGKGLGKGGAKRHRKVLRDNIQVRSATLPIMSCCCASTKLMHCSVLTALVVLCHLFTGVLWPDTSMMHAACCCPGRTFASSTNDVILLHIHRASPSPPSGVLPAVAVSSVSVASSMRRPAAC